MVKIAPLAIGSADLSLMESLSRGGVSLSLTPALARYSLRARNADLLAEAIGRVVPEEIGTMIDGVAKLGPDEWMALLPQPLQHREADGRVSVTDVSDRAMGIMVEGGGAEELVGMGCPLDMQRLGPNRAVRTLFESVEIILWRQDSERFHIDVWRSFAPWLWNALVDALDAVRGPSLQQ